MSYLITNHGIPANPYMTLAEWRSHIDRLIAEYGADEVLYTDSGRENCQLVIAAKVNLNEGA